MSLALYDTGALRFWTEREIMLREQFAERAVASVMTNLKNLNSAWASFRCEGPLITPRDRISASYDENDVFLLSAQIAGKEAVMRPETTPSSYAYALSMLNAGAVRPPLVVWQMGKSFRRETNDGASPSKLRFNEFYQLELQCIYRADSKADYRAAVIGPLAEELGKCCGSASRIIDSDRLPSYSVKTEDIELMWNGEFKEVCSVSTRNDFPEAKAGQPLLVLEVALGMDRLVCVAEGKV